MAHELPKLPYEYDALEPYFDEETMKIHHTKHHQGYVNKLNSALQNYPDLADKPVEDLLKNFNSLQVPEDVKLAIKNHGGGHANHSFWWPMLKKDTQPMGEILDAINKTFGSIDSFKEAFKKSALSLFGSGWTWLVVDNGELKIVKTPNQDSPLLQGKIPVLGIDMWEHAYYLKYQNRKADYLDAFFKIINWEKVNEYYKKSLLLR